METAFFVRNELTRDEAFAAPCLASEVFRSAASSSRMTANRKIYSLLSCVRCGGLACKYFCSRFGSQSSGIMDRALMNQNKFRKIPLAPRILLASFWTGIGAAACAAPMILAAGHPRAAAWLYALFSPVCHQDPSRSFVLFGHPCAICHRCMGIYLGLFLISWLPFEFSILLDPPQRRRLWVCAATAPLVLDVFAPLTGLWSNTPASRFVTGLLFGMMLSSLLVPAMGDFIREMRCRIKRLDADAIGGVS
jgi:uncharacterized membrane protein